MNVPKSNSLKGSLIVRPKSWNALRDAAMRLPEGNKGDIAVHNGSEWVTLPAPSGDGRHVLSVYGGSFSWLATTACEE
jgi:hypothetical protein